MYVNVVPFRRPPHPKIQEDPYPFMNNMDEITFWVYTKRAPCLMNYDNHIKKQSETAHCSKDETKKHNVTQEVPSQKKKRKRKYSFSDDDSLSTEKPLNAFETPKKHKRPILSHSDSESDLDFNIKNSSVKKNNKRSKLSKRRTLTKKNKIISSTPIGKVLRRSLRQAQLNNSHLSPENFHSEVTNGHYPNKTENINDFNDRSLGTGDQTPNRQKVVNEKLKNLVNGKLEDLSDVSGFTANYIKSTKAQAGKNSGKLKCKGTRKLVKEKKSQKDSTMIVCTNKGINTGLIKAPVQNCSTDSDQHVLNLVSTKNNNGKPVKVSRNTSILKFIGTSKSKESLPRRNTKLNISFQTNSVCKNPKHKSHTSDLNVNLTKSSYLNNSNLSRTRHGLNFTQQQPDNSVLVLSNSEQVSSMVSMNVASPENVKKKQKRQLRTRISKRRDSAKERSGFAAFFSDSDDSEPLKRKFFCA